MIFTGRFFLALAIAILLSLGSIWQPDGTRLSVLLTIFLLLATATDWLLIPRSAIGVRRIIAPTLMLGVPATVTLHISNAAARPLRILVRDSSPPEFSGSDAPLPLFIAGRSQTTLEYTVRSFTRGVFAFGDIYWRLIGPLGLVLRQHSEPATQQVTVLPDISTTGARDLAVALASRQRIGRHLVAVRGEAREFESLREYSHDDHFRDIDWKASARRGKLITRQYQIERDQRLLIMLDLGRMMSPKIGNYRKLDYAVQAAVRLSQTALQQGDRVGLLLFAQEISYYLPPAKGAAQIQQIVNALTVAQPRRLEPNYRYVFNFAARENPRRTLMVCFTDLADIETSRELVSSMARLQPRHLPMTVTMSDSDVLATLRRAPKNEMQVYEHAAAMEVWADYQRAIRSLTSYGVLTVNVPAQDLTLATLNRYLCIKETAQL
jgi:uncharacterized protein (DUF58 family)